MKITLKIIKIVALMFTISLFLMYTLASFALEINSTLILIIALSGVASYALIRSVRRDWASPKTLKKRKQYEALEVTKEISGVVFVDENKKKWFLGRVRQVSLNPDKYLPNIYNFSDVDEVYTVNGDRITLSAGLSKKKGGVSRAIVGGALVGGVGALVGAHTAKAKHTSRSVESQTVFVNILLKDCEEPIRITCNTEVLADSIYRSLVFTFGLAERDIISESESQQTPASQLREYKELLDEGVISLEEFEEKKKQLLELQ